jgi:hypothetical protein
VEPELPSPPCVLEPLEQVATPKLSVAQLTTGNGPVHIGDFLSDGRVCLKYF